MDLKQALKINMDRISKNFKHLREVSGNTKTWVASKISKSVSVISNYETGKAMPPFPVIQQYADLFKVYIGDLVGKDLWKEPGLSMLAEEPGAAYGNGRHQQRVETLLHNTIDEKEAQIKRLKAEVVALANRLKADPAAKDYYLAISEVLAHLEKE